jgi:hypothetical protein
MLVLLSRNGGKTGITSGIWLYHRLVCKMYVLARMVPFARIP